MSNVYTTLAGDTFTLIARKVYGDEAQAGAVSRANPGVVEPLTAGLALATPPIPGAPQNVPQEAASANVDEVAVLIDGQRFRFWDTINITRALDGMDIVNFTAPFEPDAPGFRETFRPFSFKRAEVTVGGEPLFTGTMVSVEPVLANDSRRVSVGCYSLPGVLNDCTPPASAYPLEFDNQDLQAIATTLAEPFGIVVDFQADPGATFERVACAPGKKVLAFLMELAKQRNIVISSTPGGALLFQQSIDPGAPVVELTEGVAPLSSVVSEFNPQTYYSHITGIEPTFVGLKGEQFTVKNENLPGVLRPFTFEPPDTQEADIATAVRAKAGRMFANVAAYKTSLPTWRDPAGELWRPNTTLLLTAPGAMVYSPYEFLIRAVNFQRHGESAVADLNITFPGVFKGILPEVLPWDAS